MIGALVRIAAPFVWRSEAEIARKLEGFSASEAGSALDMLKAAELESAPRLRRLFFRHAMDEARHARRFEAAARAFGPARRSEYTPIHAQRQNLFANLGRSRFLAFVHLAELRGERHFRALEKHFASRPELAALFRELAAEERFHVRYSVAFLRKLEGDGAGRSLHRVRLTAAWNLWRRQGRAIGDRIGRAMLALVYLVVLPLFVMLARRLDPPSPGWKKPSGGGLSRRQF